MKKPSIILVLAIVAILLTWCTKKNDNPIVFEKYSINIKTNDRYREDILPLADSPLKQYVEQTTTWFKNSIIIDKVTVMSWMDLKKYAEIHKKSMMQKVSWIKNLSTDTISFDCWSSSMEAILQKMLIEEENYILWTEEKPKKEYRYLNQLFFVDDNQLYALSSMTDTKKTSRNVIKSIKKITCLEQKE
jgi:hypothetical protein